MKKYFTINTSVLAAQANRQLSRLDQAIPKEDVLYVLSPGAYQSYFTTKNYRPRQTTIIAKRISKNKPQPRKDGGSLL